MSQMRQAREARQVRRETRDLRMPPQLPQLPQVSQDHGLVEIQTSDGLVKFCYCCKRYEEILNESPIEDEEPEEASEDSGYFYRARPPKSAYLVLAIVGLIVFVLVVAALRPIP